MRYSKTYMPVFEIESRKFCGINNYTILSPTSMTTRPTAWPFAVISKKHLGRAIFVLSRLMDTIYPDVISKMRKIYSDAELLNLEEKRE